MIGAWGFGYNMLMVGWTLSIMLEKLAKADWTSLLFQFCMLSFFMLAAKMHLIRLRARLESR